MIRAISTIPFAPRASASAELATPPAHEAHEAPAAPAAPETFVVTKTLFVAPAASDGAIVALVLCGDRAFRVTRDGEAVTDAEPDLDRAIHLFRRTVRRR